MSEATSDPTPPPDPIARLEQALREVGSDASPPRGWESRVRAAVAETAPKRHWWRIALPSLGGLAAAAAGVALWVRPAQQVLAMEIDVNRHSSEPMMSGAAYRKGDVLTLTATGGGKRREMRVYVGGAQLVHQCAPPCDFTIRLLDAHIVLALASDGDLPAATNDPAADEAAARAAGAQTQREEFQVD